MPTKISAVDPGELDLEIELGKNAEGQPVYYNANAATVMLMYTDGARGKSCEEAYESLRLKLIVQWNFPALRFDTTYLIVETCVALTQALKKKHTSEPSLKS